MEFYGKVYSDFELIQSDFFEPDLHNAIVSSSCIFVNNFTYCAKTNLKLKDMFKDLEDGSRIVSSRSFCSSRYRINARTVDGKQFPNKISIKKTKYSRDLNTKHVRYSNGKKLSACQMVYSGNLKYDH